jgi:hypothetical protein
MGLIIGIGIFVAVAMKLFRIKYAFQVFFLFFLIAVSYHGFWGAGAI